MSDTDAERVVGIYRWIDAEHLPYELLELRRANGRRDFYERVGEGDWTGIVDRGAACSCRYGVIPSSYDYQGGDTALIASGTSSLVYECSAHRAAG